jgi:hypothetical protein
MEDIQAEFQQKFCFSFRAGKQRHRILDLDGTTMPRAQLWPSVYVQREEWEQRMEKQARVFS